MVRRLIVTAVSSVLGKVPEVASAPSAFDADAVHLGRRVAVIWGRYGLRSIGLHGRTWLAIAGKGRVTVRSLAR